MKVRLTWLMTGYQIMMASELTDRVEIWLRDEGTSELAAKWTESLASRAACQQNPASF